MVIGYTQGTFDMFHIGHLNLLKNAKNQCDHLIVGVNSDELVFEYKKKSVIIPLYERLEIVSSIRYVDEVIVCNSLDKLCILKNTNFTKLFIGDDWKGSRRWQETEEVMSKFGVSVIYLPYTKCISSTFLREKIIESY